MRSYLFGAAPYALAVRAAGEGAYLYGESARSLGPARAVAAAREAERMGYVTSAELAEIEGEVGTHA